MNLFDILFGLRFSLSSSLFLQRSHPRKFSNEIAPISTCLTMPPLLRLLSVQVAPRRVTGGPQKYSSFHMVYFGPCFSFPALRVFHASSRNSGVSVVSCKSTGHACAVAISPKTKSFHSSTVIPAPPGSTTGVGHTGPSSISEYSLKKGCASAA